MVGDDCNKVRQAMHYRTISSISVQILGFEGILLGSRSELH